MTLFFNSIEGRFPIVRMLDLDNAETDDPQLATVLVVQMPDGTYRVALCTPEQIKK